MQINRSLLVTSLLSTIMWLSIPAHGVSGMNDEHFIFEETVDQVYADRRSAVLGDMEFSVAERVLVNGIPMSAEHAVSRLRPGMQVRIKTGFGGSVAERRIVEITF